MNVLEASRSTKARVAVVVVALFALVGVAAFPRIARAAKDVNVSSPNAQEQQAGLSPVTVTFTLGEDNAEAVSAAYFTQDGTATEDVDYVKQSGTVDFAPHETSKNVVFNVKGDTADEVDETFFVKLGTITGGYVKGTEGTVTILDDDAAPSVSVADVSQDEGNGDTSPMNFIVKLSAAAGADKVFFAFTANPRDPDEITPGSQAPLAATPGTDYVALAGTAVTVLKGDRTATLPVSVKGGTLDEHDEHFEVQLKATNDAAASDLAFATAKIKDDDALARLDVSDPAPFVEDDTECGGLGQPACARFIRFTVTLTPASGKRVVVDYATENRSANSADFNARSGSGDPNDTPPPSSPGLVFAAGETSKTVDVPIRGDNVAEPDERFAFNLLSTPVNAALGDSQAFGLIQNDDGGSFPTVSIGNAATTSEATTGTPNSASFTITVNRPDLNIANVQVFYATADGHENGPGAGASAVAGSDYVAATGSATINFPQTTAMVTVPFVNNGQNEPDEFFQLQLTDAGNASIIDAIGLAKITDDDPAPTISIADKTVTEGTSPTATASTMTVTLSAASGQTVTVGYSTPQPNSGTATATDDYSSVSGTLTFVPGDTSETFDIPVIADAIDEADETVAATLSGTNINDGAAVLTITDDDSPPTVSIGSAPVTEGSSANTTATLPVSLSSPSGKTITVNVATADGTAAAPGDYTAKAQTLTFDPGDTAEDFQVTVIADTLDEANETFTAAISAPTNATLGSPATGTATILDDDDAPTTSTTTTTTTIPPATAPKITTGAGPGGGPHVKVFNATGSPLGPGFMDGGAEKGGKRVARGDLDGDGKDEIITGSGKDDPAVVTVRSALGALIASSFAYGTEGNFRGGVFVAAGDVDNDGKDEVITGAGAGGGPHVRIWKLSGQTLTGNDGFMAYGAFGGGVYVAAGDVNGDGLADVITGAGAGGGPHVRAFSGAGTGELFGFMAYGTFGGGVTVAAGDLDGDGKAEIVTGVGPGGGPHLRTWKNDGSALHATGVMAGDPNFTGGINVAVGDLTGDGKAEIIVGGFSFSTRVRGFTADLTATTLNFEAYPGFGGGTFVAIGKA